MEDPTDGQDPFAPPRTTHTNCNKSRGAVLVTYLDNGRDPDIAREAARESLPFDEDSPDQGPRRATAANSNLMGGPSLQRLAADALQAVSIATASPPLAASVPKMIPDKSTATRQCSIQDEPPSAPRFTPPQRAPLPDKPQRRLRHGVRALAGYYCPFCPVEKVKHKYPRRDNLKRHVRGHHVDKDKDDPQLRDALA
ncbi:hypothetical protein FocnCong_v001825 [Fusarium oxysporum f. sp. conglutinans]|nr:hypothetical protein FocnCong_v001825 [Fusarium oxysporum f. sp. conglutinans]